MADFTVEHLNQLVGKTVKAVTQDPLDSEFYGLQFTDGTVAWIQADPEGNGGGWLQIQPPKKKR